MVWYLLDCDVSIFSEVVGEELRHTSSPPQSLSPLPYYPEGVDSFVAEASPAPGARRHVISVLLLLFFSLVQFSRNEKKNNSSVPADVN